MPDTLRDESYRVEMEIAADLVSARKRKYPVQRAETPHTGYYQYDVDKILAGIGGRWLKGA